jgi:NhaP-type Na+/H+ or K+/H+ antiporter
VFGESVLNDAVCIVLYKLFVSLSTTTLTAGVPFVAVVKFFVVSGLGALIGGVMAILAAFITKYTSNFHLVQPLIIGVCAILAYDLSDLVGASGITSILFCGIVMPVSKSSCARGGNAARQAIRRRELGHLQQSDAGLFDETGCWHCRVVGVCVLG